LGVMLLWHLVNFPWILYNALVCNYHVFANLTTNEAWNWKRYEWLKDPNTGAFYNKFDRGLIANFREMWYGANSMSASSITMSDLPIDDEKIV
jgi:hypothetical protein